MVLRFTCPYTSQQNGRAERVLCTLNDSLRTMLLQVGASPSFWPDALATATYLLNRLPCRVCQNITPYELLLSTPPIYDHLQTFGCLCYPNTASTAAHKLASRSVACVFLGYPADTKGYRCFDPCSGRVLTLRHVYFDASVFPFRNSKTTNGAVAPHPALHDTYLPPAVTTPTTRHQPPHPCMMSPPAPHPDAPTPPPLPSSNAPHHHSLDAPSPPATLSQPTTDPPPEPSRTKHAPSQPHPMLTRANTGITKPNPKYVHAAATTPPPAPSSIRAALRDPA